MKLFRSAAVAGLLVALGVAVADPAVAYPSATLGSSQITSTVLAPGAPVTVTVQNTTPGALTMQIFSAPVTIGTGTTGANGSGSVTGTIPAGYNGAHTIQVTGAGGEIYPYAVTVTGETGATGVSTDSSGGLAQTGAAATGIGILGGVLVAGGVFFVVAGRRRTGNQTPSV